MGREEIRSKLESVAEDLADLALDALRERDGQSERLYTRARRSVEKAVHLLGDPSLQDDPNSDSEE